MDRTRFGIAPLYSLFYFFHFAFYAFPLAILPLYLNALGYTAVEIALVSAAVNLAIMLGTLTSLQLVEKGMRAAKLNVLCTILSLLAFLPLFSVTKFVWVTILIFTVMFIYRGSGALVDARAVRHSAGGIIVFEHQRLFGALGFILGVYLFGQIADRISSYHTLYLACGWLVVVFLLSFVLPKLFDHESSEGRVHAHTHEHHPRWKLAITLFLLCTAFVWISYSVLSAYLSVYLQALGWTATQISYAWTVGVLSEIIIYLIFPILQRRFTLNGILKFSVFMCIVRWTLFGLYTHTALIMLAQTLHAFTFGTFFIAGAKYVFKILPDEFRDRGQGWFLAVGGGLGSLVGRLLAAAGASQLNSYLELPILFLAAAFVAIIALVFMMMIPDAKRGD